MTEPSASRRVLLQSRPVSEHHRSPGDFSRRRLLAATAAAALGATFVPGLAGCTNTDSSRDGSGRFWTIIAGAARADDPSLTAKSAMAELGPELGSLSGTDLDGPSTSMLRALRERSADDFASGRTVEVVGWLFSRTEVLLATVAAGVAR